MSNDTPDRARKLKAHEQKRNRERADKARRMNEAWAAVWKVADTPSFRAYFLPKELRDKK